MKLNFSSDFFWIKKSTTKAYKGDNFICEGKIGNLLWKTTKQKTQIVYLENSVFGTKGRFLIYLLSGFFANKTRTFLFQRPTHRPTNEPTLPPTDKPTPPPTDSPTDAGTKSPSKTPTPEPTPVCEYQLGVCHEELANMRDTLGCEPVECTETDTTTDTSSTTYPASIPLELIDASMVSDVNGYTLDRILATGLVDASVGLKVSWNIFFLTLKTEYFLGLRWRIRCPW